MVSGKTLSLELEGPGLQPMVLVDLPGIIQHHTRGMPTTTRNSILDMCRAHIRNPNAIILCIQDASRDAEASSVADVVRDADPEGDRTVFVLTKVDLAEKLAISQEKLRSTLSGERFNLHARAYFAVVTGTSDPTDSIDAIRRTEREYFASSALFKADKLGSDKLGTDNLARMVSDIFWERVRETIAQEGLSIARSLKRKETEWKNSYPNQARLSRDDLFNMGRHQILQNITAFNDAMTPAQWELVLSEQVTHVCLCVFVCVCVCVCVFVTLQHVLFSPTCLRFVFFFLSCCCCCLQIWNRIRSYVLDEVYINSADADSPAQFKTRVDNLLDAWVNSELPRLSVAAARE